MLAPYLAVILSQIGWPRPPAVDEIKIFDNDDKTAKYSESKPEPIML